MTSVTECVSSSAVGIALEAALDTYANLDQADPRRAQLSEWISGVVTDFPEQALAWQGDREQAAFQRASAPEYQ